MRLIEKKTINQEDFKVSGEEFFKTFERKTVKFLVSFFAAIVGVSGNFYAVRYLLESIRIDILTIGSPLVLDFYSFGLTGLLDIAIVLFYLMRIKPLQFLSSLSAVSISIYANYNLLQNKSTLEIFIGMLLSVLPIIIFSYLMKLIMDQYDLEIRNAYANR